MRYRGCCVMAEGDPQQIDNYRQQGDNALYCRQKIASFEGAGRFTVSRQALAGYEPSSATGQDICTRPAQGTGWQNIQGTIR